ncbi:type II secretion system ATPase GspE [Sedimentisphaera salicampi]|uniref:protein-secreting ATPase n=1 Tax=Sedimentisphaera salicampi TaxID=1941349 RepID=A0A1W6LPV1_9BACT|nr:type II secretion system ATPase GspE [Sedimentisphaera salicampi]ARN57828.1 Type II traffic warden ATPase [Sedimentisphaera salicampi]OXU13996.1 Type II traffic warden ATPase [Sedimentisphaera salicampi]
MKELLVNKARETGIVDGELLERYLGENSGDPRRIDDLVLGCHNFTEESVLKLFAEALDMPFVEEIRPTDVPAEFIDNVPAVYAQNHYVVADSGGGEGMLRVISFQPLNFEVYDNVSRMTGMEVEPAISTKTNITAAIDEAYEQKTSVAEEVAEELDSQNLDNLVNEVSSSDDLLDVVNRPPVIRLVNDIFFRALQMRASDIHIHPFENKIQIRYRIDGILYDSLSLNRNVLPLIISRIKVMAGMDIAERRLPQDGRTAVRLGQREIDLRVSTVPTAYGERCVLRILDKSKGVLQLEDLGFIGEDLKTFDQLLKKSHGVIFVTGPTGSGKSTSLYAALQRINSSEKNIMTVENPIEYQLEGISQMQVSEKKGMTFANALRHILRQDPDVIMVGEVRDEQTARMAIQSSLTGHLVFSTLHTNDSASSMSRLIDLGVEPYLVSSSIIAIMAQRLARRICPSCRVEYRPKSHELRELGLSESTDTHFYMGEGCEKCFNTGYRGRIGLYELLVVNEELRSMVSDNLPAGVLKKKAVEQGLKTLRMDGAMKVMAGDTTISEVLRVTQTDLL